MKKYLTLVFEITDEKLLGEGGNPLRYRLPGLRCVGATAADLQEEVDQYEIDVDNTKKLAAFLQGEIPEGTIIARKARPKLTADQAHSVIWFIGNMYWKVTDHVERCDVCGNYYNTWSEGHCLDYGQKPYLFCESCMQTDEFARKEPLAKKNS